VRSGLRGVVWLAVMLAGRMSWGQAAAAVGPEYDAVSVKPNTTGGGSISISTDNDRYKGTNVTLKILIREAWDLQTEEQIVGLPGWVNGAHYDVEAKMDAETVAKLKGMKEKESDALQNQMMQAALADRFHLKVHHETRELPIYTLTVVKSGMKLKPSAAGADGGNMSVNNSGSSLKMTSTGMGMDGLTTMLSGQLRRKVVDGTGLTGKYDFGLQWSDEQATGATDHPPEFPGLFTAVQDQLGLRLEAGKGPVDVIVVDKVEQPTEN
jgi:uncharacterized protein (TIGR03435 family)